MTWRMALVVSAVVGSPIAWGADVVLTSPQPCGDPGVLIDFEQFDGGDEITTQLAADGVLFSMTNGEGPHVARTTEPRQFGPGGDLEINNFPGGVLPINSDIPVDIVLDFASPMNLISFELRSHTDDDVRVIIRSTTGSRPEAAVVFDTGFAFTFAGILADEPFDEVVIQVVRPGGGVIVDNIRFGACVTTTVPADLDGDGTVTLLDFATFVDCISGPGGGILLGCSAADYDMDGDVDLSDNIMFMRWFGQ